MAQACKTNDGELVIQYCAKLLLELLAQMYYYCSTRVRLEARSLPTLVMPIQGRRPTLEHLPSTE